MEGFLSDFVSILLTAGLTAYVTAKANERVLKQLVERVEEIERRQYKHAEKIARLEGLFSSGGRGA